MKNPFPDVLNIIRTAKKGIDVREGIAQMGEYCQSFVDSCQNLLTSCQSASSSAQGFAQKSSAYATQAETALNGSIATAKSEADRASASAATAVMAAASGATGNVQFRLDERGHLIRTQEGMDGVDFAINASGHLTVSYTINAIGG